MPKPPDTSPIESMDDKRLLVAIPGLTDKEHRIISYIDWLKEHNLIPVGDDRFLDDTAYEDERSLGLVENDEGLLCLKLPYHPDIDEECRLIPLYIGRVNYNGDQNNRKYISYDRYISDKELVERQVFVGADYQEILYQISLLPEEKIFANFGPYQLEIADNFTYGQAECLRNKNQVTTEPTGKEANRNSVNTLSNVDIHSRDGIVDLSTMKPEALDEIIASGGLKDLTEAQIELVRSLVTVQQENIEYLSRYYIREELLPKTVVGDEIFVSNAPVDGKIVLLREIGNDVIEVSPLLASHYVSFAKKLYRAASKGDNHIRLLIVGNQEIKNLEDPSKPVDKTLNSLNDRYQSVIAVEIAGHYFIIADNLTFGMPDQFVREIEKQEKKSGPKGWSRLKTWYSEKETIREKRYHKKHPAHVLIPTLAETDDYNSTQEPEAIQESPEEMPFEPVKTRKGKPWRKSWKINLENLESDLPEIHQEPETPPQPEAKTNLVTVTNRGENIKMVDLYLDGLKELGTSGAAKVGRQVERTGFHTGDMVEIKNPSKRMARNNPFVWVDKDFIDGFIPELPEATAFRIDPKSQTRTFDVYEFDENGHRITIGQALRGDVIYVYGNPVNGLLQLAIGGYIAATEIGYPNGH